MTKIRIPKTHKVRLLRCPECNSHGEWITLTAEFYCFPCKRIYEPDTIESLFG